MTRYYRMLSARAKGYWNKYNPKYKEFTSNQDFVADLLLDFTDSNLSIWKVDGDATRVFFALAVQKGENSDSYFLSFDESAITASGITPIDKDGDTDDEIINRSGLHKEISNFTAKQLTNLILEIFQSNPSIETYKKSDCAKERRARFSSPPVQPTFEAETATYETRGTIASEVGSPSVVEETGINTSMENSGSISSTHQ